MSDIAISIKLPEELVERARAAGIQIEEQTEEFIALVEKQIQRREAGERLIAFSNKLQALPDELKPTPEEIEEIVQAVRAERVTKRKTPNSK